jgi:tetratricopeptide (TPR) repeat protein
LSRGLAIAVLATAAVWIWQRNQDRFRARVLLAWMGILLVPAALAVGAFVRDEWVHDRHVYFVAIPFCLLVSLLLAGVRPARRLALVESAIVLVLATGTFSQVPRFRDEISVYASALEVAPANTTLRRSYAVALWTQGRHQEALQQFQILISGEPGSPLWHELYAGALAEDGRKAEALESYSRALEKATGRTAHRAVILYRMGEIESEFSKLDLAETHLREAIGIDSQQMNYHGALAAVLRKQGNTREADEELQTEAANRNLYLSTHGPGARR